MLAIASAMINVLYLTGSFYMLEVYDRVIPSRSFPTLVGLSILAIALYGFQAVLDLLRSRMLVRVGRSLGQELSARVYHTISRLALTTRSSGDGLQPMRDLDQIRSFLSGPGPVAFLDLPWLPFYIGICFIFHFWLGVASLVGVIGLIVLTMLTDKFTKEPSRAATGHSIKRNSLAEASRRNSEVLHAMGMTARMAALWDESNIKYLEAQQRVSDIAGGFGAISKVTRMVIQSGMLGVGAFLVIHQEATGGVIIAGSIIGGRALAPIDSVIANWKNFVASRQAWQRLTNLLGLLPTLRKELALSAPVKSFESEMVCVNPPGDRRTVVQDVNFRLEAGSALGIVGPSGGGKSCLARALVGVWTPVRGTVRIDGATLDQWSPEQLGRHIGYLPQDVELLAGTVAQNICRFDPDMDSEKVLAAAKLASVHELVLKLPNGYETDIGENGSALSAGQRQRIALARALYDDPFLVVLDEPNSNLDLEGEEALTRAIFSVRARHGIAIIIAHRPSALAGVDQVMVIAQGRCQAIGPKEEVLAKMMRRPTAAAPAAAPGALRVVNEAPGAAQ
ncbi:type I secretion system permease/ATPase [Bradyrhizobium uaiense]|uniref:Type I secretion system permease/ATPase n=1 Tax=Bradyrhizobium uaiense TaxID=2594946 RepID=A0A6P1BA79_9BRAD|nr:type I secretion system permease/ATPase [Bradyrhizobium uaiense]